MRLRLILSFALIVLISVSSVAFLARRGAAYEVRSFMFHGGMAGIPELVTALEEYYHLRHTWQSAEDILNVSLPGAGPGWGGPGGMRMPPGMMNMMGQRLRLADAQGNLIADTGGIAAGRLNESQIQQAITLQDNGVVVGYLLAEGGISLGSNEEAYLLNRLSRASVLAGLIAGSLALGLAMLLAYSLAQPLRTLTNAAGRLAQGDLSQRVAFRGHDELTELGNAFNHMAASLQQAEQSRRAMTTDIAHELRTPLAVQRAHLEALQDGIYPLTAENLSAVLEQNLLLSRLVDDLRTLALADAGQLTLERTPTDFAKLVQRTVERFEPQAATRQVSLSLDLPPDTSSLPLLSLDPMRIEQIINNLLSNALRYTPQGGKIECQLSTNAPSAIPNAYTAVFTIHDSGAGIPLEALPHVFERFYRADRARSRAEGGTGLGLAIARQIAEAHDGTLTAANHPQGGAIFTLTLPIEIIPRET